MNGTFEKVMCVTTKESEGREGKKFYSATVTDGETVLAMGCTEEAFPVLEANKLKKPLDIKIKLSEYQGSKTWRIVSAWEAK